MSIHLYENTDDMQKECQHWLSRHREAMVIAYNDEENGGTYDVTAHDDGSIISFEDRCRQSIDYCFGIGGWDKVVIATNLSDEATALAAKVTGERMRQWFEDQGEEIEPDNVLFNGRRFEAKYVLQPEPVSTEDRVTKQEVWLEQLGIEKMPGFPACLETSTN